MKILTVSIAAYNVEKYLNKCVTSLINKYIDSIEILIENDGSTDNTYDIGKSLSDKYPSSIKIIDKKNGGYGSTINNSISIATGKYFKQLDGDDWFDKDNFELFINFLSRSDTDFVFTPYYRCVEGKKRLEIDNTSALLDNKAQDIRALNKCGNFSMHELTIKTELLRYNGIKITEKCFYTDNEYTFLPLLKAHNFCKFSKPVYCYRLGIDGQSVSLSGVSKHYKDSAIVANVMYKAWNSCDSYTIKNINNVATRKLIAITDTVYTYYIVSNDQKEAKSNVVNFDRELKKNYRSIYKRTFRVKKIALLRISHFWFYAYVRKKVLNKW